MLAAYDRLGVKNAGQSSMHVRFVASGSVWNADSREAMSYQRSDPPPAGIDVDMEVARSTPDRLAAAMASGQIRSFC